MASGHRKQSILHEIYFLETLHTQWLVTCIQQSSHSLHLARYSVLPVLYLPNHVGGEHDNIQALMETLRGRQVANTLGAKNIHIHALKIISCFVQEMHNIQNEPYTVTYCVRLSKFLS